MKLVFLGPPGAGKGTIAVIAKEVFNIPHISTGDLFRANIKNGTELGKKVQAIMAKGELVPDSVTVDMLKERIKDSDCDNGFILDGFPRTIPQADALSEMIELDKVINFVVENDVIIKRLSGRRVAKNSGKIYHMTYNPPKVEGVCDETGEELIQRDDDKPEAILHRLDVYVAQTQPLIDYYKEKGLLLDLDASKSPNEVVEELKSILK